MMLIIRHRNQDDIHFGIRNDIVECIIQTVSLFLCPFLPVRTDVADTDQVQDAVEVSIVVMILGCFFFIDTGNDHGRISGS